MGDTDSIVVKIANGPGTTNSFVLKVWSCQEYRVNPNSTLYQYANVSPNYDPVAMDIYRRTMQQIPLAVVCAENAKFWETVLRIIRGIAGAAAFVPGPIGAIGTGVGMVTDAVSALPRMILKTVSQNFAFSAQTTASGICCIVRR